MNDAEMCISPNAWQNLCIIDVNLDDKAEMWGMITYQQESCDTET